ncbi:MAG: hypothetical protein Q9160_007323 [Pyrenula sp. 1 TL-2023]
MRLPTRTNATLSAAILTGFVLRCSAIAVTGVSAGVNAATGARPFRTEINSFSQSGPAFDLYIQALQVFSNQSGDLSYFGISAGIHGFPLQAWDGVNPLPGSNNGVGYCTHNSILFPVWHRPYMAIFEQAMWTIVNNIASQYPSSQRQTYTAAVNNWRIPYWDWADVRTPGIPSVLSSPQITINTPSGRQTVTNPLYAYRFPNYPRNIPNMGQDFEGDRLYTVRHPTTGSASGGNAQQDDQAANQAVLGDLASLHQQTYQLLTDTSVSYNNFASDANSAGALSIEVVHNTIHIDTGGDGGHINVDRIFALWQVINPNKYITPGRDPGTWAYPPGTNTFHTPASARATKTFGYTYPEIVDWGVSTSKLRSNVIAAVNKLYNSAAATGTSSVNSSAPTRRRQVPATNLTSDLMLTLSPSEIQDLPINNLPNQYVLNITLPQQPESSTLYFFLGDAPSASTSSSSLSSADNLLTTYAIFSKTPGSPGPPTATTTRALLPITAQLYALVVQGVIPSLDLAEAVAPLLNQKRITWTSATADNQRVQGQLTVQVLQRDVQPATSLEELPEYGEWREVCEGCVET